MLIHGSTYIFRIYIYIPYTVSMVAVLLYFIHYVHGYMKSFPVFENIIHAHTRIWFFLICKHLTARKLTDNSQEEKPEAAQELWPTLLSPVKTNSTFFRKCVSIRATAYMFFMTTFVKPVWVRGFVLELPGKILFISFSVSASLSVSVWMATPPFGHSKCDVTYTWKLKMATGRAKKTF